MEKNIKKSTKKHCMDGFKPGQTFNFLTVISYCKEKRKWKCKCKCGKITYTNTTYLRQGISKSCGCESYSSHCVLHKNDIFNHLTVIKYDRKKQKYLCKCECGNKTYATSPELKSGRRKSCGCVRKARVELPDNLSVKRRIFRDYMYSAKYSERIFTLTEEQFINIITKNCTYCGQPPKSKRLRYKIENDFLFNGIDRVDNSVGYTIENCVPCCKMCNLAKSNTPIDEWKAWLQRVFKKMFNDYPEMEYTQASGNGNHPEKDVDIV